MTSFLNTYYNVHRVRSDVEICLKKMWDGIPMCMNSGKNLFKNRSGTLSLYIPY